MRIGRSMLRNLAAALPLLLVLAACGSEGGDGDGDGDGTPDATTGTITGTVSALADGAVLAGATVATEPATTTATTAADGTYTLADVEAGTYTVIVTAEGFLEGTRDDVTVTAGATVTLDFALTGEAVAGNIAGVVTDAASGDPIEGATVTTDPATESVTTGADGSFELVGVAAGTYAVQAAADGYEAATVGDVAVVAGETATADVALTAVVTTGAVVLTVENACTAQAIAGAIVTLPDSTQLTTDAAGQAATDLAAGEYTLTVAATGFIPTTVTVTATAGVPADETIQLTCQHFAVAEAARRFLAQVTAETDAWNPMIAAQDLFDNLNDGDDANDPLIVSVRKPEDYAVGHIPGAINIGWKAVAEQASLDTLDAALADSGATWVALYCYTAHTGGIASTILNLMGYKVKNLRHGMMSWSTDPAVRVIAPFSASDEHDFATEATVNESPYDNDPPMLDFADVADEADVVRAAGSAYLNREGMAPTIAAADLFDVLNDGDDSNDPFILSVRKPEDYAIGHIPGAVNIPWTQVALEENLRKLPTDRKIVVYCYTGHTGAVATAVLGALGYDTVNLKFGIMSWTTDAAVRVVAPYSEETDAHDFPTEP